MYNNKYRLSYLPLFYRDLEDKITYIDDDPNDKIMEVRRFLYNGQNKEKIL